MHLQEVRMAEGKVPEKKKKTNKKVKEKREIVEKDATDKLDSDDIAQLEAETVLGYRVIDVSSYDVEGLEKLHIHKPTIGQQTRFDSIRNEYYGELMRSSSAMTRKELEASLEKRGVNLDKMKENLEKTDNRVSSLVEKILSLKAEKQPVEEALAELKKEKDELREKKRRDWIEYESMFQDTIEAMVNEKINHLKVVELIRTPDGEKYWDSVEDLLNEKNIPMFTKIMNEASYFWAGVDPNFFDNWLEELLGKIG
jgi:hypothetical protein